MADEATQAEEGAAAVEESEGDFASLLQKEFRPRTDQAKDAVESAVATLAEQALANASLISEDVLHSIAEECRTGQCMGSTGDVAQQRHFVDGQLIQQKLSIPSSGIEVEVL